MELFIRANDIYMEIHKVTLKDGHIPMIGDQLPPNLNEGEHGYTNPYKIEPAVWFKVKVVDSISIDCTKRAIMWNSDSSLPYDEHPESSGDNGVIENTAKQRTPSGPGGSHQQTAGASKRRRRVSESMYIGGELYGFESDLDELFDTLQLAVVDFASSVTSREVFNSEIMRMLHCHVLPVIKLTSEDVPRMKKLYTEEEQCIKEMDELILLKDKQMDEITSAMMRMRSSFLTNLVIVTDAKGTLSGPWKTCNRKVAKMLVEDIETDISDVYQHLDDMQKEVEEAKQKLYNEGETNFRDSTRTSTSTTDDVIPISVQTHNNNNNETEPLPSIDYKKVLEEKRSERNDCHKKYEKLLYARENLREYVKETIDEVENPQRRSFLNHFHRSPKHQEEPLHNIYMGMREKLEEVKKEAKALIDKKVLMISVKEAIRTTLEELELHDESTGYDVGVMHGSRPTDVLHRSRKPKEWLSLAEKMSELVGHHSNQACLQHNNFCKVIADRCQAAVIEKQLVNISCNALRVKKEEGDGFASNSDSGVYVTNTNKVAMEETDIVDSDPVSKSNSNTPGTDTVSPIESLMSDTSDYSDSTCDSKLSPEVKNLSDLSLYEGNGVEGSSDYLLQVEGQLGDEDIVIVHNTCSASGRDPLRKTIEDLKTQIHNHFKDMSRLIQSSLDSNTQVAFKKIWLCYENYFYEVLMTPLTDLYREAFKTVTDRLEAMVPALTVEDLDLDDTTIANMLEEEIPDCSKLIDSVNSQTEQGAENNIDDAFNDAEEEQKSLEVDGTCTKVQLRKDPNPKRSFRGRLNTHPLQVQCGGAGGGGKVFPGQISPRGDMRSNGVKRIKIHYPISVTVIGHRQSWPRSTLPEISENLELGVDALNESKNQSEKSDETFKNIRKSLFSEQEVLPDLSEQPETQSGAEQGEGKGKEEAVGLRPIVQRKVKLKPEFQEQFTVAKSCLAETLEGKTPLSQLQSLMRCLREVTNCLSEYQYKYCSNHSGACSDDIIDMLIILLLNCDVKLTASLYPHLMMLTDTLPPFFEGGPYQFCLVQFSVAYQFLQDRLLLKNRSSPPCP